MRLQFIIDNLIGDCVQPNILFIVIDALRAKNLSCYGYSKPTSPNIDVLAKEGVLFENAYSCAVMTDPSLTTIFSGKYPRSHGIMQHGAGVTVEAIKNFDESGTLLLPQMLKANGYATLAVDWLGRWHRRGYDYYSGVLSRKKLKLYSMLSRVFKTDRLSLYSAHSKLIDDAKNVTDKGINLLKKIHNKKFFLFLHYWDTHIPYNPPQTYFEQFARYNYGDHESLEEILKQFDEKHSQYMKNRVMHDVTSVNEILARYDGAIAYVDFHISRILQALEDYGILDNTFIILTADHGESHTEHGIYFGHHGLYDQTIHVPLIFRHSAFPKNQKVEGFIQHTDVVPTILDVLGIKTDYMFDGTSLLPLIYRKAELPRTLVYVEEVDAERKRAIRTSNFKYIYALSKEDAMCRGCGRMHGDIEELYGLNKDPDENQNVIDKYAAVASALKEELSNIVTSLDSRRGIIKREIADRSHFSDEEKVKKRLRELGYI
jgi:arylsulfatase A-like enzyme